MNPVSKALGLDYNGLKRRVWESAPRADRPDALFVEANPQPMDAELDCVIELQKGDGARLRLAKGGRRRWVGILCRSLMLALHRAGLFRNCTTISPATIWRSAVNRPPIFFWIRVRRRVRWPFCDR